MDAELDSLRAVKLPRTRELILKAQSDQKLRSLLQHLSSTQSEEQQKQLLLWYLDAPIDFRTPVAADPESVEAIFDDTRSTPLLEHRQMILNSFDIEDTRDLCMFAISRFSAEALRPLLLRLLVETEARAADPIAISPNNDKHSASVDMSDSIDKKRMMALLEYDDEEPETLHNEVMNAKQRERKKESYADIRKRRKVPASTGNNTPSRAAAAAQLARLTRRKLSTQSSSDAESFNEDAGSDRPERELRPRGLKKRWAAQPIEWVYLVPSTEGHMPWIRCLRNIPQTTRDQIDISSSASYGPDEDFPEEKSYEYFVRSWFRKQHAIQGVYLNVFQSRITPSPTMSFDKSSGNKQRACDHCIHTRRLCLRVIHQEHVHKLCLYPLPEDLRAGVTWKAFALWVMNK